MSRLLYRVGRFCTRHRYAVLGVWIALLIATTIASKSAGQRDSDNLTLPGTDSTEATDILDSELPKQSNGTVPIVLQSPNGSLTKGANRRAVDATVHSLERSPTVRSAVSPLSSAGSNALSKDKTIGYISLTLTVGPSALDDAAAQEVIDAADPARQAGLIVAAGGYLGQEVSTPSTESSELIGIVAAVIILLFTFGTVTAMTVPIATAIVGLVTSLNLITLLSHVMQVPSVAPTLATMIGLGVGIDYALFLVTRHRQRLADGFAPDKAAARACATSGSAVAFAGGTVVIALCSLSVAGIPLISALGFSAAVAVLVAVLVATTLLPALLAILGTRIESIKVPGLERHPHHDQRPHGWARWATGVARRPWPALIVATAALAALAIPVFGLTLGQQDNGQLPTSTQSRQAYDLLTEGFGPGVNGPLLIASNINPKAHNDQSQLNKLKQQQQQAQQQQQQAIAQTTQSLALQGVPQAQAQQQAEQQASAQEPSKNQQHKQAQQEDYLKSTASDPRLVYLAKQIGDAGGVKSVTGSKVSHDSTAAVFTAIPKTAPSNAQTETLVDHLRDSVIPSATAKGAKAAGVDAHVGGATAGYGDLAEKISEELILVIGVVVALSFVLLTIAFRSLVIPATAAVMNMLSVAAAYGVLTLVFEDGFGISLIGLDRAVPVVSYVPLLMFAILFGLSMDYQVFLVSRIGERYLENNRDNTGAVVDGLASSARVITAAALIMVCVFSSFVLNGDPTVKQFGLGMAVAIAVDATIVRCLLVPAAMVLLGRANWWFPAWLEKIVPQVGLEAEDALPPPEASA